MAGCRDCWVKTRGDYSDLEFCADCEHLSSYREMTDEQITAGEIAEAYLEGLVSEDEYRRVMDWYDDWARS